MAMWEALPKSWTTSWNFCHFFLRCETGFQVAFRETDLLLMTQFQPPSASEVCTIYETSLENRMVGGGYFIVRCGLYQLLWSNTPFLRHTSSEEASWSIKLAFPRMFSALKGWRSEQQQLLFGGSLKHQT